MQKGSSLSRYLKYEKDKIIATQNLKVLIPKTFEDSGLMQIENTVRSLGVFQVIIDGKQYVNVQMICILELAPASITDEKVDEEDYYALNFDKGSTFIVSRKIIKDPFQINQIYNTFLALGKLPSFLTYETVQSLFDKTKMLCDVDLGISHCIFELIYAHMHRSAKDPFTFHRNTSMKDAPIVVPLQKISHGPTSSSGRFIGSYPREGMVADMVTENTEASEIENMLRA